MDNITLQQNPTIEEITTTAITDIPEDFREDVMTVIDILKPYHVRRVILYGSVARGDFHKDSDLDFCVEGLDASSFFIALAECLLNTRHSISIVDLDSLHGYFLDRVLHEGTIVYEQEHT
jgi:uncharacterized protein